MSAVLASPDPGEQVAWAKAVLYIADRATATASGDSFIGPAVFTDPMLRRLADEAVQLILTVTAMTPLIPEAMYQRAMLASQGSMQHLIPLNPRAAFRDFEVAARGGYHIAWFRLGRDYEQFSDHTRAKDCFTRGIKADVASCCYRMGMAHLLGQLSLPASPTTALPLLKKAASLSSIYCPQPAYVMALILLNEFSPYQLPPELMSQFPDPLAEARRNLERAAYLHFAPAQFKLGHAYEFALPPFPFDALLSVSYYSLASEAGEAEADMALSKWFLCGAKAPNESDWLFEKDEVLAWTFADKAASKGLPSAEFAVGYYKEVGVGGLKDLAEAKLWYQKVRSQFPC